jgi:epoxyqueuosine reductase
MDGILKKIREEMKPHGYQARTVSIAHLPDVQESVGRLVRQGLVDQQLSEKWHFYLMTNEDLPEAKTIIVLAMPQPITSLRFEWRGRIFPADIPPTYLTKVDDSRAEKTLKSVLETAGYKVVKARLALKTLATRSGLAEYGRNNISYVPGMGSLCQLVAFYSDCPCEEDNWQESRAMEACDNCTLCLENCPTESITADRFLIHAEKCLGFLNEKEPDIPYWAKYQPDWTNALIGCMRCQFVCPVDKPYLQNIKNGPAFSREETVMVLNKISWEQLSLQTRQKLEDIRGIYPLMARNLQALIEKQEGFSSTFKSYLRTD